MSTTAEVLKSFVIDTFPSGSPDFRLIESTSFLDTGLIDSTGVLELVDFLEEEFDLANAGRRARLDDELAVMRSLLEPGRRRRRLRSRRVRLRHRARLSRGWRARSSGHVRARCNQAGDDAPTRARL